MAKKKQSAETAESKTAPDGTVLVKVPGRKPKQTRIPGTEDEQIDEIIAAAEDYEEKRDARIACTKEEVPAQARLLEVMRKHDMKQYRFGDLIVKVVETKIKAKVKRIGQKDPDDGDEE